MKHLLIASALIEVGAGFALLCFPSAMVELLLGSPLNAPTAVTLGRVAGTALLALAVACWLAHYDAQGAAARGLVCAMAIYNFGVAAIFAIAGIGSGTVGVALWPAFALHAIMTVLCTKPLLSQTARMTSPPG